LIVSSLTGSPNRFASLPKNDQYDELYGNQKKQNSYVLEGVFMQDRTFPAGRNEHSLSNGCYQLQQKDSKSFE
jgi:hypothetical protein